MQISWVNSQSNAGVKTAKKCLTVARKAGINLFDNAEVYGSGQAELIMGEAIRQLQVMSARPRQHDCVAEAYFYNIMNAARRS